MKKYILTAVSLIIIGVFLIYKNYQADLKLRCTSASISTVTNCMERGDLYPQEQYDFYYNTAANNLSISILNNDRFYQGFILASNNCGARRQFCDKHDENVIRDFAEKCTFATEKILFCTESYFTQAVPNEKNISKFLKIVQFDIKKNNEEYGPLSGQCNSSLKYFYKKIPNDLKKEMPLEIQKKCILKPSTYMHNGRVIYSEG